MQVGALDAGASDLARGNISTQESVLQTPRCDDCWQT